MSDLFEEFKRVERDDAGKHSVVDERPIFGLRRLDWDGKSSSKASGRKARAIQRVVSGNGVVVIATSACTILRWKMVDALYREPEEIEFAKPDDFIENILLDPSGHHVIISMKSGENYHLHSKSTKPKKLRLSGVIESAAFDVTHSSELNTKSFLVGTGSGAIYELGLDNTSKEKVCQLVYQLEGQMPITAIYFEQISGSSDGPVAVANSSLSVDQKFLVLCATTSPTRLYHFVGGPTLGAVFADYSAHSASPFTELPGELRRAELHCFSKMLNGRAQNFALMTGAGVYNGSLLGMSNGSESVLMEAQLLPYAETAPAVTNDVMARPISFSVTEFHFLILRGERLQALSSLNGALVQESALHKSDGIALGLCRDIVRDTTLLFTTKSLFQVEVADEARQVWSIYLKKALSTGEDRTFDAAYEHSKTKERKMQVMLSRAEFNVATKQWEKAATYFARSGVPFEEVALRLSAIDNTATDSNMRLDASYDAKINLRNSGRDLNPLRVFLLEVLKALPPGSKSQRTMVCIWIMEIFLHQITASELNGKAEEDLAKQRTEECKEFIRANRISLDPSTVLQLIVNRDNRPLLLFFAKITGDYHRVVSIQLTEKRYSEAIVVLSDAPFEKVNTFIYEVAPVLMEAGPESSVELFLSKSQLSPSLLLPALLRYTAALDAQHRLPHSPEQRLDMDYAGNVKNFALVYFEELLKRQGLVLYAALDGEYIIDPLDRNYDDWKCSNPDPIVLPTMAWLLAKYDNSVNEMKICRFVQELCAMEKAHALQDIVVLDAEFILRQCRMFRRRRSAIYALLLLGQPLHAAEEALTLDPNLSKAIAVSETDPEVTRSIWLKIAQSVIGSAVDMKQAVDLIEESQNVLTIEDLLPLLPDFTEIDLFKEQICSSLDTCGTHIQEVKLEMQELATTVESTLQELHGMKNRAYSTVSNLQKCELCFDLLHRDQFYLFPCSHGFHSSCLLAQAPSNLAPTQAQVLRGLLDSMQAVAVRAKESDSRARSALEALQAEVDGLVAADCPLCGYAMINSISCSLIPADEAKDSLSWQL